MISTRHTTTFRGSSISYWTYGETTYPVAIFIHGFRGTHHGFEKIVEELSDFYCIVPDLPGFGESQAFSNGNDHSLANYVRFVYEFVQSISPNGPVFLVGHSFGSIVASHFSAQYPRIVSKLILINPISAPALQGPKKIPTKVAQGYYWLAKNLPEKASYRVLKSRLIVDAMSNQMTLSKDKLIRAYVYDQHRKHFSTFASPVTVAEAFTTSVSHTTREVTRGLTMPTLVIAAEKDQISSIQTQRDFARELPNGTLHELKNVGHLVHYEKATEAAVAIDAFLRAS